MSTFFLSVCLKHCFCTSLFCIYVFVGCILKFFLVFFYLPIEQVFILTLCTAYSMYDPMLIHVPMPSEYNVYVCCGTFYQQMIDVISMSGWITWVFQYLIMNLYMFRNLHFLCLIMCIILILSCVKTKPGPNSNISNIRLSNILV